MRFWYEKGAAIWITSLDICFYIMHYGQVCQCEDKYSQGIDPTLYTIFCRKFRLTVSVRHQLPDCFCLQFDG